MTTHSTAHRLLAIASGITFTTGGLLILLGASITAPATWTIHHALTALTVAGTIAAGHLAGTAWRARSWLAAAGFAVLFATGTGLVVVQSLGRQAETSQSRTLSAGTHNQQLGDKTAELARARQRLADAEREVDLEIKGRPDTRGRPTRKTGCGSDCEDWTLRASEIRSHISTLEGKIAALGAPVPVEPEADKVAELAALVGADGDWTRLLFLAFKPLLWTLFFEIGSVVSLGFAFGGAWRTRGGQQLLPTTVAEPMRGDREQTDFGGIAPAAMFVGEIPDPPTPPKPRRRRSLPANVVLLAGKHRATADDRAHLRAALANVAEPVNNHTLAQLMGVTDGESSRRWHAAADMLHVERRGREVLISLRRDASVA